MSIGSMTNAKTVIECTDSVSRTLHVNSRKLTRESEHIHIDWRSVIYTGTNPSRRKSLNDKTLSNCTDIDLLLLAVIRMRFAGELWVHGTSKFFLSLAHRTQ